MNDLADWDYLGANVYQRGTTTPALPEYSIQVVNGVRVGVIGAVTQETASLVSPAGIQGIDFGDPVAAVNRVAAQLKDGNEANGEADVVVAEYHNGANLTSSLAAALADSAAFAAMVNNTSPSVDAIFNGHTHQAYVWDANGRPVMQSGSYGTPIGVLQLGVDPVTKKVVEYRAANQAIMGAPAGACLADAQYLQAKGIVDDAIAHAKVIGQQVVGSITADITTAFVDATPVDGIYRGTVRDDRLRESAMGNLLANVWLDAMQAPGRPGADIGIMNPGGIRAELYHAPAPGATDKAGEVTYAEAAAVNPFANTLQTIDVSGHVFKKVLEQQWQPAGAARAFLKLGLSDNVRYTYDPNRPAGDRVTSISYDGQPMDLDATYRVTAGSFLISGGDNFTALRDGKNSTDSGLIDTDVFINYLAAHQNLAPSFTKNGVGVLQVPAQITRNQKSSEIRLEGIDLTSLGAPANTEFAVLLDGRQVGTFAIETKRVLSPAPSRDGVSVGTLTLQPQQLKGNNRNDATISLRLVAKESGTVVDLPPIQVAKK